MCTSEKSTVIAFGKRHRTDDHLTLFSVRELSELPLVLVLRHGPLFRHVSQSFCVLGTDKFDSVAAG